MPNVSQSATKPSASGRGLIECYEPATRAVLGTVPVDAPESLAEIVARGRAAQKQWAKTSFAERRRVLGMLCDYVLEHADELCEDVVRDSGKTRDNAMLGEIWPVVAKLRWTMAHGEEYLSPETVSSGLFVHKRAIKEYHPLGVVGVIAPWNYPLQNILGPTIPALMAGNAVVAKASEWVAWSSARFQAIFDEVLDRAGYPRALVQIVQGYADTGAALINGGVDTVVFTGSLENGKKVARTAADTLTPVILELGGKDPLIVCDDAHLEQAAHAAVTGCFLNCGQNCLATERVLVFDSVFDQVRDRVVELTEALVQGPPLDGRVDVAAVVSPLQLDLIEELVRDAVAEGATLLTGGKRVLEDRGQFFAPTILTDVREDMRIAQNETFGPVMLLMRVQDEDDAIRVANGTAFGLSSTVCSKSAERSRRIAGQLVAGSTNWSDYGFSYMAMGLPFGGVRGSGYGRLNGAEGLRACTNIKSVLEDRLPLRFPAKLFPIGEKDYDVARGVIRTIYSKGAGPRLKAAGELLRSLRGE